MITVSQIRNGGGYLSRHLSANDYYSEGERVEGYWMGKGAEKLGLRGKVEEAQFEALRTNLHPFTGQKLTPRRPKVAFHDIVLSAPKAFSVAAIVGGDERLVQAFHEASRSVLVELEKHAAVRLRAGNLVKTEEIRVTGNVVCAAFQHDSSRLLNPQLHTHLVIANTSFDEDSGRWLALQPRQMLEESKASIRNRFYDELAERSRSLGYGVSREGGGFRIEGISRELEDRFSERTLQRQRFEERYEELFGRSPSKERVEAFIKEGKSAAKARFSREFDAAFGRSPEKSDVDSFVRDWRSASLKRTSTGEVRRRQVEMLSESERKGLREMVAKAKRLSRSVTEEYSLEGHELSGMAERHPSKKVRAQAKTDIAGAQAQRARKGQLKSTSKQSRQENVEAIRKREAMRRLKRQLAITRAMQGHPAAVIARTAGATRRR